MNYASPLPITAIVDGFRKKGYHLKFRRETTCLYCKELNEWITPDSFTVDDFYYLEDHTNPDKDRTVYAITSTQGLKGFLIDSCLVYEDNISTEMTQKLEWNVLIPGEF